MRNEELDKLCFPILFSVDREKLRKHQFPLVVVEKIGNLTKEVFVKEGENKQEKLAQASNELKKDVESLSSKFLHCSSRHITSNQR